MCVCAHKRSSPLCALGLWHFLLLVSKGGGGGEDMSWFISLTPIDNSAIYYGCSRGHGNMLDQEETGD